MTAVVVLLCLVGLVLLLLLVSLVRTLFIPSRRSEYVPAPDPGRTAEYAEKLARMVRVETVSIPGMIGTEEVVYGIVEPTILDNLQNNVDRHVGRVLRGEWQ